MRNDQEGSRRKNVLYALTLGLLAVEGCIALGLMFMFPDKSTAVAATLGIIDAGTVAGGIVLLNK